MDEALRHHQAFAFPVKDGAVGHAHVLQFGFGVVAGHVECPVVVKHFVTGRVGRHDERRHALGVAGLARGAREHQVAVRARHLTVPALHAVDDPVVAVAFGDRVHPGGVAAVARFGQPEGQVHLAGDDALDVRLLLRRAVGVEQRHEGKIADDRQLVLQVVVQAQPPGGQMLADGGDHQTADRLTAAGLGQAEPEMAGRVGAALHFRDQRPPFGARTPVVLPIGAGVLPSMIEKLHVGAFERLDLRLDESVEFGQLGGDRGRQLKVHGPTPFAGRALRPLSCSCRMRKISYAGARMRSRRFPRRDLATATRRNWRATSAAAFHHLRRYRMLANIISGRQGAAKRRGPAGSRLSSRSLQRA